MTHGTPYCKISQIAIIWYFQLKFAVDRALNDKKYEEADIGSSMQRVMKYWTVRDKMNSVHDDLVEEGVTKIEVTDEGLKFHYNEN